MKDQEAKQKLFYNLTLDILATIRKSVEQEKDFMAKAIVISLIDSWETHIQKHEAEEFKPEKVLALIMMELATGYKKEV